MRIYKIALSILAVLILATTALAAPIDWFVDKEGATFIDLEKGRVANGAKYEDNVILFVTPESQAMWQAPEDLEGYLYIMVRSGSKGDGMEYLDPSIFYEVMLNKTAEDEKMEAGEKAKEDAKEETPDPIAMKKKRLHMKTLSTPANLAVMLGKYGVYTNWIRSFEPIKLKKGDPIYITCWVDWGVVALMCVAPDEFPEPYKTTPAAAPRAESDILIGSKDPEKVPATDIPDLTFEGSSPFYFAPHASERPASVKLSYNALELVEGNTTVKWVAQSEAEGYVYLKVQTGTSGSEDKFVNLYSLKIDNTNVGLKPLKTNAQPDDKRYKNDVPDGWLRSEQMVKITPGSTVSVTATPANVSLYQTLVSKKEFPVK